MSAPAEDEPGPLDGLGESLAGDRGVVLDVPREAERGSLDDADGVDVVETPATLAGVTTTTDRPLVVDGLYGLVARHGPDGDGHRSPETALDWLADADRPVVVRTTPYRLRWLLRERRGDVERVLGAPSEWEVHTVRVDESRAETVVEETFGEDDGRTERLSETLWTYPLADRLDPCLGDGESAADLLGGTARYETYRPWLLVDGTAEGDVDAVLGGSSVRDDIVEILGDVTAAETWESVEDGVGVLRSEGLGVVGETVDLVREEGLLDILRGEVGGLPFGLAGAAAGGLAALSSPWAAVAYAIFWLYATRRESEATRRQVRGELRSILGEELRRLPAAEREDVEEELGLPPRTLEHLQRVASGEVWTRLERAIDETERAHDRLDGMAAAVERHESAIETVIERLAERAARPKVYRRTQEFADDELYDRPSYEPPGYELRETPVARTVGDGVDDPREVVCDVLDRERAAVVLLTGESGVGKTRLMIEVAERVRDAGTAEVRFVQDPAEVREPPTTGDTVLFLDEIGRMDDREQFLRLASASNRTGDDDRTIQVVAAVRPVYRETAIDSRTIPESVSQYEIELSPLDRDPTAALLSGLVDDDEAVERLYETTGGNPFLSRLLATAEADAVDGGRPPSRRFRQEFVEETLLAEAGLLERGDAAESLLAAVAVLGEYDVDASGQTVADALDVRRARSLLDNLTDDTGYLERIEGDGALDGPTFTHRFDVVAEYLRYRDLIEGKTAAYRPLLDSCLSTDAVGIARGLVELRASTIRRFEAVDEADLAEGVDEALDRVAADVVDAGAELPDIVETEALVGVVRPDAIPHDDLQDRYDRARPGAATAEQLWRFVTVLYRRDAVERARDWLDRLADLEADADDPGIGLALAKGLVNAIHYEGEAGNLDTVSDYLDRLKSLEADTDDPEITLALANGLYNALTDHGRAGNLDTVGDYLDRLKSLEADADDPEITLELAKGLFNAINAEGESEAGTLDTVETHLDRLKSLEAETDDPEITLRLAKGLFNAINAEGESEAGNLGTVSDYLDRLKSLEADADDPEITLELAKGLVNAINYEGESEAGNLDTVGDYLDRLKSLEADTDDPEITLRLAKGLYNALTVHGRAGNLGTVETHLDRLKSLEADTDDPEITLELANGLVNAINVEGEAGTLDAVETHCDRLADLADDGRDDVVAPATLGHLAALSAAESGSAARRRDAVDRIVDLSRSVERLGFGPKPDAARAAVRTATERLLRAGEIDAFERLAGALRAGLSAGRWASVDADAGLVALELHRDGVLSADEYRRASEAPADGSED